MNEINLYGSDKFHKRRIKTEALLYVTGLRKRLKGSLSTNKQKY